jgi:nucleoside-diphosphate-sugar epimerase
MQRVAVTGANGFVGRALIDWLSARRIVVRALVRAIDDRCAKLRSSDVIEIGDMTQVNDWRPMLEGVDAVVHLAARVHRMQISDEQAYLEENVGVTERLVAHARDAGVAHFVFVSSIKVNGERTTLRPFTAADEPRPQDPYARSKLEAELRLKALQGTAMRLTVIRPPLIYGPHVGANFQRLLRAVRSGLPLPLGRVANRRSVVSVWNLADLIASVLTAAGPHAQTLLVADREIPSTVELIRIIADAMGKRARMLPVPVPLLRLCARALGREAEVARLVDSLVVDISPTCAATGWMPPLSLREGVLRTVKSFLHEEGA